MTDRIKTADFSSIERQALCHTLGVPLDSTDVHIAKAMDMFGVTAENVTPEMRRLAKHHNLLIAYGGSHVSRSQEKLP